GPDGAELPPGEGTAVSGKPVYDSKCAACHGATGREGPQDVLVGGRGSLATAKPLKTIGSYWPYATTVYDYIFRAMPFTQPESLTAAEVYGVTAYLLYLNGIIGERDLIDRRTLPQVRMPNRHGFVPDPRPERRPRLDGVLPARPRVREDAGEGLDVVQEEALRALAQFLDARVAADLLDRLQELDDLLGERRLAHPAPARAEHLDLAV